MNLPQRDAYLEAMFPNLYESGYRIIGFPDRRYNCVDSALDREYRHFKVGRFTLDTLISIFERHGYKRCQSHAWEAGFEKVAIYGYTPSAATHVARMKKGVWVSKLGKLHLIEHRTLEALEGVPTAYGAVKCVMKRPVGDGRDDES